MSLSVKTTCLESDDVTKDLADNPGARSPDTVATHIVSAVPLNLGGGTLPLLGTLVDIDMLLEGKENDQAVEFLRCMVADLMNEVEVLNVRLDESEQEVAMVKTENRMLKEKEHDDRISTLIKSLDTSLKPAVIIPVTNDQAEALSPDEATTLVVSKLAERVEDLNNENSELLQQRDSLLAQVDDLHGQNEAYEYKISALETQFKSINKTRQKVVTRLSSHRPSNRVSPLLKH